MEPVLKVVSYSSYTVDRLKWELEVVKLTQEPGRPLLNVDDRGGLLPLLFVSGHGHDLQPRQVGGHQTKGESNEKASSDEQGY